MFSLPLSGQVRADEADLAKAVQNPVGSLISIPIETTFDFGAANGDATFINLQPVIPIRWRNINLINRTIISLIDAPGPIFGTAAIPNPIKGDAATGLGDINHLVFFSPAEPGKVIWGFGPSVSFPTATDDILGSEKWSLGPAAVLLTQPKPWTLGVLTRTIWSVAGADDRDDVNQFLLQPFINYNLADGWYLTTGPNIIANWNADEKWTVPVGGGVASFTSSASNRSIFALNRNTTSNDRKVPPTGPFVSPCNFCFPRNSHFPAVAMVDPGKGP